MRKSLPLVALTSVLCAALAGCSKDAEMDEFIKENDALVAELKAASNEAAAKKAWEGRKDALKKRYDAIKEARGFQVKDETKKKLENSLLEGTKTCLTKSIGDDGIEKICDEYERLLEVK